MLPFFSPWLTEHVWGPFRLLSSHLILIGLGTAAAALFNWICIYRWRHRLARDGGRPHTPTPEAALGKPTGAGVFMACTSMIVLAFVLPSSVRLWQVLGCLFIAMLTGLLDDAAEIPWGELKKGMFDMLICLAGAAVFCQGRAVTIWLPLTTAELQVPPLLYTVAAAAILWICINATNCSDGVDGLAGSLTLLSLLYLGGFLYVAVGHREVAEYLLIPHNPNGAHWAILAFTCAGSLAGYLWHNAEPSAVLMGDAGSRFLGLLLGVCVLATGNPLLVIVVAPVVLINGGTGLVKVALLRLMGKLGMDIRMRTNAANKPQASVAASETSPVPPQWCLIRWMHNVRFPLHDHCRRRLGWSNAQVLLRFMLIQAFVTPLFFVLIVKLR